MQLVHAEEDVRESARTRKVNMGREGNKGVDFSTGCL